MNFSQIFKLKAKKFWWMDVLLYFAISALIATLLCYAIFYIKNVFQGKAIIESELAAKTVGTASQKQQEEDVKNYQKKIADFTSLLSNHEFASNVFVFMEAKTNPDVWYKQFTLDAKNKEIKLSGESENMESISRQVAVFEDSNNSKYIENIGILNSSLGQTSRINFNTNLLLNSEIFSYISDLSSSDKAEEEEEILNIKPENTGDISDEGQIIVAEEDQTENTAENENTIDNENTTDNEENNPTILNNGNNILSFKLTLSPEVIGIINQDNRIITLKVPYGTNLKNLIPIISVSPGATVTPASKMSQDFSSPVSYIVKPEDGSVQEYKVSVIEIPQQQVPVQESANTNNMVMFLYIGIAMVVVSALGLLIWKFLANRSKNKEQANENR